MVDAPSAESSTTASATGSCVLKDVWAQLGVVIAGTHVGRRSVGLGPKMREVIGPKSGPHRVAGVGGLKSRLGVDFAFHENGSSLL